MQFIRCFCECQAIWGAKGLPKGPPWGTLKSQIRVKFQALVPKWSQAGFQGAKLMILEVIWESFCDPTCQLFWQRVSARAVLRFLSLPCLPSVAPPWLKHLACSSRMPTCRALDATRHPGKLTLRPLEGIWESFCVQKC